jgi:hypothetical protein
MILVGAVLAISLGGGGSISAAAAPSRPSVAEDPEYGFAKVDRLAMNAQGQRLQILGSRVPEAYGGVYFSEETGELNVRYVDGTAGRSLVEQLSALDPHRNDVPVRYERAARSLRDMRLLAAQIRNSKAWAGAYANQITDVSLDEWRYRIQIDVTGNAEPIEAATEAAFGLRPYVSVGTGEYWLLPGKPTRTR